MNTKELDAKVLELKIMSLEGAESGSVTLPDAIFGLEPRAYHTGNLILHLADVALLFFLLKRLLLLAGLWSPGFSRQSVHGDNCTNNLDALETVTSHRLKPGLQTFASATAGSGAGSTGR